MPFFRILSTILVLLSLLLLMIALGSDFWVTDNRGIQIGLWKTCIRSVCFQYSSAPGYIDATRAFLFLALIAGFLSLFTLIASIFRSHLGPVALTLVSAVASFSAGLCAMIALAVFTGEVAKTLNVPLGQVPFGWSFGLGWASFPLFLITGAVMMFVQKSPSS
ncbi:protein NKG7-like [Gopherus flavomarginatus]|uniref:protein NKG7-like n=1 Tax=Gopherus flavomarginatus TaxID=286002 RepID=UPI0021CBDC01|nr:protein NKG7-like [Gopherus flavomarginatus]